MSAQFLTGWAAAAWDPDAQARAPRRRLQRGLLMARYFSAYPATVAVWAGPVVVAVQNVHLAERWSARLWRCLRRSPLDGLSLINRTDITFPSLPECIITHLTVDCQGTHSVLPIDAP